MMQRRNSIARLKELERDAQRSRRYRDPEAWRDDAYRYADYRLRNDYNTLGPQEDVVEKRRAVRKRVVTQSAGGGSNVLAENMILLLFLVASIYGLYKVTLYLLIQS